MKIVITGGHFSPAHALIKYLRQENEVTVIGRRYSFEGDKSETLEYKICRDEEIPFYTLNAGRLQRRITPHTIPSLARFPKSIIKARQILAIIKPEVVVTFGGYIGLPVALAAKTLNIPVILHEQTQKGGLAAKVIGKFASAVLISFESSGEVFGNKNTILTGNPIRSEIFKKIEIKEFEDKKPMIYITGGSTGAHILNEKVFEIVKSLVKDYSVFHQTGNADLYGDHKKALGLRSTFPSSLQPRYIVKEFFPPDEAIYLLQNSEYVISRAGINTVLELIAAKTPAILIPLPSGQQNEQRDNALLFKNLGLGDYLEQDELTSEKLHTAIRAMIKNKVKYRENFDNAQKFIHKDAVEKIAGEVYRYGRRSKREISKEKA